MESGSPAREIEEQHRALAGLFARTREALRSADAGRARGALDDLRAVLEIHFGQEGHLYYPAIRALRPEQERTLRSFLRDHERFRDQLQRIQRHIEERTGDVASSFEAFVDAFVGHEVGEERLLRSLELESARNASTTPGGSIHV